MSKFKKIFIMTIIDDNIELTGQQVLTADTVDSFVRYIVFTATSVSENSDLLLEYDGDYDWDVNVALVRCTRGTDTYAIKITCPFFLVDDEEDRVRRATITGTIYTNTETVFSNVNEVITVSGCTDPYVYVMYKSTDGRIIEPDGFEGFDTRYIRNEKIENSGGWCRFVFERENAPTSVSSESFYNADRFVEIKFPSDITEIGGSSISSVALTRVSFSKYSNLQTIGRDAFLCANLIDINIPSSVSVEDDAFGESYYDRVVAACNIKYEGGTTRKKYGSRGKNGFVEDGIVYNNSGKTELLACQTSKTGSIEIPDSVTTIGSGAFCGCENLTSITIPTSVTSIGNLAFSKCTGLSTLSVPSNIVDFGNYPFYEIPNVYYNREGADTSRFGSLSVNGYVSGNLVYENDSKTKLLACFRGAVGQIEIPDTVTEIANSAFRGCSGLTSVTIPSGVTVVGYHAFSDCTSIVNLEINGSQIDIGSNAFSYVPNVKCQSEIGDYGQRMTNGYVENGIVYNNTSKTEIVACLKNKTGNLTITNSVTGIRSYAFSGCNRLTHIEIPNSVTSIGEFAFSGCSSLTSVTISNSVTSIGDYAFFGCHALESVSLGNGITTISKYMFYMCVSLTSVTIPNTITRIYDSAFGKCASLEEITIPSSVTRIESNALLHVRHVSYHSSYISGAPWGANSGTCIDCS